MKIINGTVYSKGNPTLNFGYYDPRTKAPYISVQGASQYLISHLSSIPTGFTICVNEDNKPVEYWWDGTAFVLKVNGVTSEQLQEAINNIPQQEITFPTIVFQTAYISVNKNTIPQTPVGGDLTTPPSGWFYEVPQYQSGKKIYYSTRNYNSSIAGGGTWDTPVELVSQESILEAIPVTETHPFTLYIAINNPVPPAEEVVPNAPTHTITLNNNDQYVLQEVSAADANWSEDYPSDTVDKTVWKSTNNFNVETNYAGQVSITNTGWTTPRKYVDIDGILDQVTQDAQNYLTGQLAGIRNDINGLQGTSGSLSSRLSALETSAATGELPTADAQIQVNALRGEINQYAYKVRRRYSINNIYIATLTSEHKLQYDLDNLSVVAIYDKTTSEYQALFGTNGSDKAVIDDGVVYTVDNTDFIIDITNPTFTFTNAADTDTTSVSRIITLAQYDSSLNQIEHELYATVLDSRWGSGIVIYCQYDENPQVLGVNYAQQLVDATTGAITNLVSSNSTNGLKSALQQIMAGKIETDVWSYFENGNTGLTQGCIKATTITQTPEQLVLRAVTGNPNADPANKDVQSSIVDLIAGKLTLSASSNGNGVVLTLDGVNGNTYLHTHQFDIDGEVIAKAIAAKELNINNLTYLNKDGSLEIASGLKGNSYFEIDGNGYIAGGLISWGNLGTVYRLYTNSAKTEEYRFTIVKKDQHLRVYDTNQSKYINVIVKGASISNRYVQVCLNENSTANYYIVYNTSEQRLELSSTNVESNLYITSQSYSGQELRVKGMITADGGLIGGWTIGTDKLYNSNLIISPDSIYSSATSNTNYWAINKSGSAQFCKGKVSFADDGSGFIGNNSNNNPTISWTTNGTVSIPVELITGTIVANQVLIAKGSTNNYAGISGVDVTSDDSKVIWSGGARTGTPTFYVTRDGRIFGKEGTLNVINNNHITNLSIYNSSNLPSDIFIKCTSIPIEDGVNTYVLDVSKVGDVVYLPNVAMKLIMPFAFTNYDNTLNSEAFFSTLNVTEVVGRKIVLIAGTQPIQLIGSQVDPLDNESTVYYLNNGVETALTSGGLIIQNGSENNGSQSTGVQILDVKLKSYKGYMFIYSVLSGPSSWCYNINSLSNKTVQASYNS